MATAQHTRPRAVVGVPRRAAWQLKSAMQMAEHGARGGVVTKIGANFDWQFQLPIEVGVLTTANFVGSWHCQSKLAF